MSKPTKSGAKSTKKGKAKKKSHWFWRWTKRLFILGFVLAILGVAAVAGILYYYSQDLPTVEQLRQYDPKQITRVVDRNGELLGEIASERRTVVPMDRIPRNLVLSVLAAEDADFYVHQGLDYMGLTRAVLENLRGNRQGASTISQQTVKLLLLSPERTLKRKIRELLLTFRMEEQLTKDEILHLYLNTINFGHGRYGAQEAARFYFGKDVQDLTLAECATIGGIPQSPRRLSPRSHPERNARRKAFILNQLERKRAEYWPDLSVEDIQEARETQVELIPRPSSTRYAPEALAIARRVLKEQVGEERYAQGGYTVHLTLDVNLQRKAREAAQAGLRAIDERHGYRGPLRAGNGSQNPVERLYEGNTYNARVVERVADRIKLDIGGQPALVPMRRIERYNQEGLEGPAFAENGSWVRTSIVRQATEDAPAEAQLELGPQAAVVVIDPRTRDVLAMVGGYDKNNALNRAMQSRRQPGSTFKPLVYGLGVKLRQFTPATLVDDAPVVHGNWRPDNYSDNYQGPIRLRHGLAKSINLVAVRVMEEVGPEKVVDFARELGIESELSPTLALALGASEVKPIEMANAYATFAAGGRWAPTRLISRIEGPNGDVELPALAEPRDVLTPAEAYVITSLLTSVVKIGTARRARALGRPAAGKTGTTNEAKDAWFCGYTPEVVAAVWVGFDDQRTLGNRESGGKAALPIWIDTIRAATEGRPVVQFVEPAGVAHANIDPATGKLAYEGQADAMDEVFLSGTVPTERAAAPGVLSADDFMLEQFATP